MPEGSDSLSFTITGDPYPSFLIKESGVCPSPYSVEVDIGVNARDSVQAGTF